MQRVHGLVLLGWMTLLLTTATARAGEDTAVWAQWWKQPDGQWMQIGLVSTRGTNVEAGLEFVTFSFVMRDTILPEKVEQSSFAGDAFTARLSFRNHQDESKPVVLEFLTRRDAGTSSAEQFTGPVMMDGKEIAQVRFVRIPTTERLHEEIERIIDALTLEIGISQASIPPMREHVKFWYMQLEEDRKYGRSTTGTQTRLSLTMAESTLGMEESRLSKLETYLRAATDMKVRLAAELRR